ncbi:TPA: OprD family outer membrane porin [Pseudomonas aeruginosa]
MVASAHADAAGFAEDSKASITLRNYYMDRDFKDDGSKSAAREWAQGIIGRIESGFTEGNVGFGLDAAVYGGIKLDSSPDRTGTELLPVSARTGRAADDYSRFAVTGKLRFDETEVRAGDLLIYLPSLFSSPTRLLPQTFRGVYVQSKEVEGLTLHAGYLDRINRRNSSNYEAMGVASPNRRFDPRASTSHVSFAGGDYQLDEHWLLKAYQTEVADLYAQTYLGFLHTRPLAQGSFTVDVRTFFSEEAGSAKAGPVDNRNLALQLGYALGNHRLSLGYMRLSGDTATPYISGSEGLVISELAMSSDFVNPDERVWLGSYQYDFTGTGMPGLTSRIQYADGEGITLAPFNASGLRERELQLELRYVVQSGPFAGVALRARQSIYRNDFPQGAAMRDENQFRLLVDYNLALW